MREGGGDENIFYFFTDHCKQSERQIVKCRGEQQAVVSRESLRAMLSPLTTTQHPDSKEEGGFSYCSLPWGLRNHLPSSQLCLHHILNQGQSFFTACSPICSWTL